MRRVLIEPLREALRRPRKMTEAALAEMLAKLPDHLDHHDEGELIALREGVLHMAGGPRGEDWPSMGAILTAARAIRARPLSECRLTTSWMRSEAGRREWREHGPLAAAELLLWFARSPRRRPPSEVDLRATRERADRRRGRLAGARRRAAEDRASPADHDEIAAAERDEDDARRFVFGEGEN